MVKVVIGMMGSSVANGAKSLATAEQVKAFLDVCASYGVRELDTARVYNDGRSEELLGEVNACERFEVSTKAPGFAPGSLAYERIMEKYAASIKALRTNKMDIYYIHGPDRTVPLEGACKAMNDCYKQGHFRRFGLSNLNDEEVQRAYDICKQNGYVLPSVYQGGYSPLHRKSEKTLLPLLKKLNMAFYAFSPLAGGMLAKPIEEIVKPHADSRYAKMPVFGDLFLKDKIIDSLKEFEQVCDAENVGVREATCRWFTHHSPLTDEDGVIWGASSVEQLEKNLKSLQQGPLPQSIQDAFETLWTKIEDVAPGYCS